MRGGDGEIRAFYNVCQHRAHELVQGAGNLRGIVCPYHAWSYEIDGRLKRARNSDKVEGFDKSAICLSQVRVGESSAASLRQSRRRGPPMAERFPGAEAGLRDYVPRRSTASRRSSGSPVEERCNWKVTVENYSECYHCGIAHPSFTKGVIDPKSYDVRPQGQCLRHTTTAVDTAAMSYEIDTEARAPTPATTAPGSSGPPSRSRSTRAACSTPTTGGRSPWTGRRWCAVGTRPAAKRERDGAEDGRAGPRHHPGRRRSDWSNRSSGA